MFEAVHHGLAAVAVLALGAAALRAASVLTPRPLERVVAGAVLGASAAALEALALGLVALGTEPAALALAAILTWIGARRLPSADGPALGEQLRHAWRRLAPARRAATGAAGALLLAWVAWMLAHPLLGIDSLFFHLPSVNDWLQSGRPGAVVAVDSTYPVGSYPLTNEVLLSWSISLTRAYTPLALWHPAMTALLACAGWLGLRAVGAPRLAAGVAVAAVATAPSLSTWQLAAATTDLPALAWLTCCGALCAASVRRPALLGVAVAAAGLAVGTKTTGAPIALFLLAAGARAHWGRLRSLARPLAIGTAAAVAVGGYWYLRNLVEHGSPLWPFVAAPWGDPVPPILDRLDTRLIQRPAATLALDDYKSLLAGVPALVVGAIAAPLLHRARQVALASGVGLAAVAIWTVAPFTGATPETGLDLATTGTIRYLMPAAAACAAATALSAAGERWRGWVAIALLSVALAVNLERSLAMGFSSLPPLYVLATAVALGALAGLLLAPLVRVPAPLAAVGAAASLAAGMALAAPGWLERHGRDASIDGGLTSWLVRQPEFAGESRAMASWPVSLAVLGGERLQHRTALLAPQRVCAAVRGRASWALVVVFGRSAPAPGAGASDPLSCLATTRPAYDDGLFRVYRRGPVNATDRAPLPEFPRSGLPGFNPAGG